MTQPTSTSAAGPRRTYCVRPPEYFPGLSFLALLRTVDTCFLADSFQYSRQSFQNRCRVRTPDGGHWLSVPLEGGQHGVRIAEVKIDNTRPWQRQHWRSLEFNYRSTPYFEHFESQLKPLFVRKYMTLGELTCDSVGATVSMFGFTCHIVRVTEIAGDQARWDDLGQVDLGDDLHIPDSLSSPDGARAPSVTTVTFPDHAYRQNFAGYVPSMSGLDLLFNLGPAATDWIDQRVQMSSHS